MYLSGKIFCRQMLFWKSDKKVVNFFQEFFSDKLVKREVFVGRL